MFLDRPGVHGGQDTCPHLLHVCICFFLFSFTEYFIYAVFKVQGKDRNYCKFVAEKLGLDGSYVSRTYIEQIQLEKLVNDVMV